MNVSLTCSVTCPCSYVTTVPVISLWNNNPQDLHSVGFEKKNLKAICMNPQCQKEVKVDSEHSVVHKLYQLVDGVVTQNSFALLGDRLFHAAVDMIHMDYIEDHCKKGYSVKSLVEGKSPLYRACEKTQTEADYLLCVGKRKIADLLLEYKADPNQKNNFFREGLLDAGNGEKRGATPLHAAAELGDQQLVTLLLNNDATIDELNDEGRSPLFLSVYHDHEGLSLFLINEGASVNIRDGDDNSLLAMAIRSQLLSVVQALVQAGADVNELDKQGTTVLHEAIDRQNPEILEFLLNKVAKDIINTRQFDSKKPLTLQYEGFTPLALAVRSNCFKSVDLLVQAGADLSLKYSEGITIVELAETVLKKNQSNYEQSKPGNLKLAGASLKNSQAIVNFLRDAAKKILEIYTPRLS